jgi:ABC-2 type transport system ATP-binding protein
VVRGIHTEKLSKVFPARRGPFRKGPPKTAVDGLTLDIPPGRVTGLLGLNGAGKTTTIKMLATLLRPSSGTATVDGMDVVANSRAVRRRINLIAGGERMVYARMTGRENLWYFGQLYDIPRATLRARIDHLLDMVGLAGAGDTAVEAYSRGMAQRLSIARGLINDPAYLLLDEPTIGLDAPIARDLRKVVATLAADGRGVLLTSHYLSEVEELCDYVYLISDGRHLAEGSPEQLKAASRCVRSIRVVITNPGPRVVDATNDFVTSVGGSASFADLDGGSLEITVRHADDVAGPLVSTLVAAGAAVARLDVANPTLEDAVMALAVDGPAESRPEVART